MIVSVAVVMVIALFALVSYQPEDSRYLVSLDKNLEIPQYETINEVEAEDDLEDLAEAQEEEENPADEDLKANETKVSDKKQKKENNLELLSNNFKEHSIILGELKDSHDNSDNSNNDTKNPDTPTKGPSGENNTQNPELPDNNEDTIQKPGIPNTGDNSQKPVVPDTGDNSQKPEQPDDKEEIPNPNPSLINIDTSNWKFEKIEAVYDGKERVALVTGLPDYVTPVYTDNKRTNAGTTTARVSFEVPEGYAVPKSMETQIIISKATIEEIKLDKMWMLTDLVKGTITITPPATIPKGVICNYEVNGENSSSYVINDAGIYSVIANFDLTEEMKENYQLKNTTSKAVYQITPEMWSTPKYDLFINELDTLDGNKKVEIWFQYNDSSFHASAVQWNIRYDYTRLELLSSTKGSSMSMGSQSPYGPTSTGFGYAMGNFYTWATLQTLEFKVLDENATDIAINLTNIEAPSADDFQKNYTNGTGIVLNQQLNLINVTLPKAQTTKTSMQMNLLTSLLPNNARNDEVQAEDIADEDVNAEDEKEDGKVVEPNDSEEEGVNNPEIEEKEELESSTIPETGDSKKVEITDSEAELDKSDEEEKEDIKVVESDDSEEEGVNNPQIEGKEEIKGSKIPETEDSKKAEITDSEAELDKSDEEKKDSKVLETVEPKKQEITDTKPQESEKEVVDA